MQNGHKQEKCCDSPDLPNLPSGMANIHQTH